MQCEPMLKLMAEQVKAVHVRPVSAEPEQAYDKDVITNPEIRFKKDQVTDDTCPRDANEIGDCMARAVDGSVRTAERDVCDPVTDGDVARDSGADTAIALEVEGTSDEHVSTLDCDCRERREVRQGRGSAAGQGRNETEDELAEREEESSLLLLLEQRLQFVLRSLTKICLSKAGGTKKDKE